MSGAGAALLASLTKAQREAVAQLREVTSCSDKQAVDLLKAHSWKPQLAIDRFFNSGSEFVRGPAATAYARATPLSSPRSPPSLPPSLPPTPPRAPAVVPDPPEKSGVPSPPPGAAKKAGKAGEEFARLVSKAADKSRLGGDELLAFATELGIDPFADPAILVIMHATGAKNSAAGLSKDEFVTGLTTLDCDSVAALRGKLDSLRARLKGDAYFPSLWAWAYSFNCDEGQKTLALDVCRALTSLLLTAERWPLVGEWTAFLEQAPPKTSISKDAWGLVLDFARRVPRRAPCVLQQLLDGQERGRRGCGDEAG